MRTGRPKASLVLSEEQRDLATLGASSKDRAGLAQRARIVLACATGKNNGLVARKPGVLRQTVGRWRSRFVSKRLDGMFDKPRPGAPRKISDAKMEAFCERRLRKHPTRRHTGVHA
jgi:transposase